VRLQSGLKQFRREYSDPMAGFGTGSQVVFRWPTGSGGTNDELTTE